MTPEHRDTPLTLLSPVESLRHVTADRAEALRRLGIRALGQLIAHLPARHQFEEAEGAISDAAAGRLITARGEITDTRAVPFRPRPRFEAVLIDDTGRLDLVWFNQTYLRDKIRPGTRLRVQGKLTQSGSKRRIINPRWEIIPEGADGPAARDARLRPIYPATEDLPSWALEKIIHAALDDALPLIEDHLPADFRRERALPTLADAYRMMHRPASLAEVGEARRRLVYDELLLLQLGVAMKRAHVRRTLHAPALRWNTVIDEHVRARIPFKLTEGQERVINEIAADLQKPTPANRLIQGDVGAGKTVVALYAMLMAVASRHQAALMAPTELLAEQHFASISSLLGDSSVRVGLLTGAVTGIDRDRLLSSIASGRLDIVIGTHALLTDAVTFDSLAVAVIDEQHRFGVHQRARLREKMADERSAPHTLVMTATPIPRTLALTVFGDLDVSMLKGLPPGRSPIATRVVSQSIRPEIYAYVRQRIDEGEQAYVVAPTIGEEAGLLPTPEGAAPAVTRDVQSLVQELRAGPLAGARIAAVHGRLARDARERIMSRFRAGELDVLVATTVIEVGVDVPNATLMVVEHAERFGLAQLHQLRGRVGRGPKRSVCVFIGPDELEGEAAARLNVLAATSDGFDIAEKDLELRGPGEFIGIRQAGAAPFRISQFPRDMDLLMLARRDATAWIDRSPLLAADPEKLLRSRLLKAHGESLGLVDVG
ncbi:MAG: ATP-dependent DNA helicase RecG [Planctomycetota bacterium]|nr:ATP-dependent DNA helicase RecG [Planctomycetota bacterium]